MTWRRRVRLLAGVTVLVTAAAVVAATTATTADPVLDLQRAVGGLGGGASITMSPCSAAFDSRGGSACAFRYAPLPLRAALCPSHGMARSPKDAPR